MVRTHSLGKVKCREVNLGKNKLFLKVLLRKTKGKFGLQGRFWVWLKVHWCAAWVMIHCTCNNYISDQQAISHTAASRDTYKHVSSMFLWQFRWQKWSPFKRKEHENTPLNMGRLHYYVWYKKLDAVMPLFRSLLCLLLSLYQIPRQATMRICDQPPMITWEIELQVNHKVSEHCFWQAG